MKRLFIFLSLGLILFVAIVVSIGVVSLNRMNLLERRMANLERRLESEKQAQTVPLIDATSSTRTTSNDRSDEVLTSLQNAVISLSNKLHVSPDWNVYSDGRIQFSYSPFVRSINEEYDAQHYLQHRYMGFADGSWIDMFLKTVPATTTVEMLCSEDYTEYDPSVSSRVLLNNIPTCRTVFAGGAMQNINSVEAYEILVPARNQYEKTRIYRLEFNGPLYSKVCETSEECLLDTQTSKEYQVALKKIKDSIRLVPAMHVTGMTGEE